MFLMAEKAVTQLLIQGSLSFFLFMALGLLQSDKNTLKQTNEDTFNKWKCSSEYKNALKNAAIRPSKSQTRISEPSVEKSESFLLTEKPE